MGEDQEITAYNDRHHASIVRLLARSSIVDQRDNNSLSSLAGIG